MDGRAAARGRAAAFDAEESLAKLETLLWRLAYS